jgi:hypothetical protein
LIVTRVIAAWAQGESSDDERDEKPAENLEDEP